MATSTNTSSGARKPASTRKTATRRRSRSTARRRATMSTTSSTQPRTRVGQAQQLAQRVVLVPVGAGLVARDNLVSSVSNFATKYRTRTGLERELRRYERRGATARNRVERQVQRRVRRTRTRFERELRQRRNLVERTVRQNRRRVEREVRSIRRDLNGTVSTRAQRLVANAQELISSTP